MKILWRHDSEQAEQCLELTTDTAARDERNRLINSVDSRIGGYVRLYDHKGALVSEHPRPRDLILFQGGG